MVDSSTLLGFNFHGINITRVRIMIGPLIADHRQSIELCSYLEVRNKMMMPHLVIDILLLFLGQDFHMPCQDNTYTTKLGIFPRVRNRHKRIFPDPMSPGISDKSCILNKSNISGDGEEKRNRKQAALIGLGLGRLGLVGLGQNKIGTFDKVRKKLGQVEGSSMSHIKRGKERLGRFRESIRELRRL